MTGALRYDRVWTSLTKLGYLVTALGCNTADYGLPQQRSRAWLMCVLKDQTCPNAEFLMPEALKLFRCQPLPLDVLLSTQVLEKQDSRTSNKPSRRETQPKWKDALIQVYDQLGKAGPGPAENRLGQQTNYENKGRRNRFPAFFTL